MWKSQCNVQKKASFRHYFIGMEGQQYLRKLLSIYVYIKHIRKLYAAEAEFHVPIAIKIFGYPCFYYLWLCLFNKVN